MIKGRVKRKRTKGVEQQHQEAFVDWFKKTYPELAELLNLASFGENIGGRRMNELKAMGLTPGYPDLFLAYPKRLSPHKPITAPGLYIEMKKPDGRLRAEQKRIHKRLIEQGYQVDTCYNWDEAKAVIEVYLG